jgi:hypothetical protein
MMYSPAPLARARVVDRMRPNLSFEPQEPPVPTRTTGGTLIAPTRRSMLATTASAVTLPLLGRKVRAAEPIAIGWVGPLSPPGGYA